MIWMRPLHILLYALMWLSACEAGAQLSPSPVKITLLTEGPGAELASVYGHTGLRIREVQTGRDYVFHYGLYDFDAPGFYRHFLAGILLYKMGGQPFDSFYRMAVEEQRNLYEQDLNLDSAQSMQLYDLLHENYKKENRQYYYDFLYDNCSTRPRDMLEQVWQGTLQYPADAPKKTYRRLLSEFQQVLPWINWGIDLIIGSEVDTPVEVRAQCFLPMYLMNTLDKSTLPNGPAVPASQELYKAPPIAPSSPLHQPTVILGLLLLLEGVLFWRYRAQPRPSCLGIYDWSVLTIAAITAVFLCFLWWGTDHHITKNNWNLLWLSPLFVPLVITRFLHRPLLLSGLQIALIVLLSFTLIAGLGAFLPQSFHPASYLFISILLFKLIRMVANCRNNRAQH